MQITDFIFRLVSWSGAPPQINAVCKRCLYMFSANTTHEAFYVVTSHDCKNAKVANFLEIPEKL